MRKRYGYRVWEVRFKRHNGNRDFHGTPTYEVAKDWYDPLNGSFLYGELLGTEGGETIRGRQVTAQTSHVIYTDYDGARGLTTKDKAIIGSTEYQIVEIDDPEGMNWEMRIQLRREA